MNDYGLSDTEMKMICTQIERRKKYREEFLRLRTDPCKNSMEAGHVFDEALQRYIAMKATQYDHFKPNMKTIMSGIYTILPMIVYGYVVWNSRQKFLCDCRCGRIRYKDRIFKLQ